MTFSNRESLSFFGIFGSLSIFIFILLLRVPLLMEHHNFDELMFISWGRALIENGPFSLDYSARLISSYYHSMMFFFSVMDVFILRLIVTSVLILNALFIFYFSYRIYSLRSGIAGSLTYLAYMGLQVFQGTYYTQELFSNFWISLAIIVGIARKSFISSLILGICVGFGFVSRPLFLLFAVVIFIWQFILISYPNIFARFKHALIYSFGFLIPIFIEFSLTSYYSGSFETYIDQFKRTLTYGTGASSTSYFSNLLFLFNTQKFFLIPLTLVALIGIYRIQIFSKKYGLFFLMWVLASLANIFITGQFFLHYTQILILPLAILAGIALGDFFSKQYLKREWINALLLTLIIGGYTYFGHPHLNDYFLYKKNDITLRDFWKRNNIPDWTEQKNAALYLKQHMKQHDQYFAWTSTPIFYSYLGASVLPNIVYDAEMVANKYAYMSWKRISSRFNYKENQRRLIKKIKSKNPPEWISIDSTGERLPQMIEGFPDFFHLVSSNYNYVKNVGGTSIFKIKNKEELANLDSNSGINSIPISVLVKNYKIDAFIINQDNVNILTSNLNALSEKKTFVYSVNFSNLPNDKKNLQISLEDIYDNEELLDMLKNDLDLSISKANYVFSKASPEEQIEISSSPLPKALLLSMPFIGNVERIFIQTDNIMYEGPGLLGRFPPIFQDIKNPELFLFGRESDLLDSSKIKYIYAISPNKAEIYFNKITSNE